ncbi:MAG: hypothetical protein V4722_20960 [Bacteroidota bacterium]
MFLYTNHITPRLEYMAHWLGTRLFGTALQICTDKENLARPGWVLNYTSKPLDDIESFWINPHPLLFQSGISPQSVEVKTKDGLSYFFETGGDHHFDVLAASFYLIQRYEEYLPHTKDMYGRYAHENSLAFRNNFLHWPLVDLWINELRDKIQGSRIKDQAPGVKRQAFSFVPTFDIDIAYSYRGKGFIRNLAGVARSFGQWQLLKERWYVLLGKQQDPFDIFNELDALHQEYDLEPIYFFLMANKRVGYDKNIPPATQEMKNLAADIGGKYATGIHPSWQSGDDEYLLAQEIETLRSGINKNIFISRQHYIRMQLPETYQRLISHGIIEDHSMGYGSINGFRGSSCVPYYWYDLQTEQTTPLKIVPFCYMEANSIFEQKHTPAQALEELKQYHDVVKKVGGTLSTIFHNHLIGMDENGRKWMDMYTKFLKYLFEENSSLLQFRKHVIVNFCSRHWQDGSCPTSQST